MLFIFFFFMVDICLWLIFLDFFKLKTLQNSAPPQDALQLLSSGDTHAGTTGSQKSTCRLNNWIFGSKTTSKALENGEHVLSLLFDLFVYEPNDFKKNIYFYLLVKRIQKNLVSVDQTCPGTTVFTCPVSGPLYLGVLRCCKMLRRAIGPSHGYGCPVGYFP